MRVIQDLDLEIRNLQFSPDGQRILFFIPLHYGTDGTIWTVNRDGGHLRLVTEGGDEPAWSPDGRQIVNVKHVIFGRDRIGNGQLWIMTEWASDNSRANEVGEASMRINRHANVVDALGNRTSECHANRGTTNCSLAQEAHGSAGQGSGVSAGP